MQVAASDKFYLQNVGVSFMNAYCVDGFV